MALRAELVPKGQRALATGHSFPLDAQRLWVLGSDAREADIVIEAASVGARHAHVVFAGIVDGRACWELVDCGGSDGGSDNGTFLNGLRVTRARLEPGDLIAFGLGKNVREGGTIPELAIRASFRFQDSEPLQVWAPACVCTLELLLTKGRAARARSSSCAGSSQRRSDFP
jgi:hypothetical protein